MAVWGYYPKGQIFTYIEIRLTSARYAHPVSVRYPGTHTLEIIQVIPCR